MIDKTRPVPDSLIYPVPATLPMGFSWAMFYCQNVTDHCTLAGSADLTTPHPGLTVANMAWDLSASDGRMPTNLKFWLSAPTALMFMSHVSSGLDVHA